MHTGDDKRQYTWSENLKGLNGFESLGLDWKIILKWIITNRMGECGPDLLTQDEDEWWALVNAVRYTEGEVHLYFISEHLLYKKVIYDSIFYQRAHVSF